MTIPRFISPAFQTALCIENHNTAYRLKASRSLGSLFLLLAAAYQKAMTKTGADRKDILE